MTPCVKSVFIYMFKTTSPPPPSRLRKISLPLVGGLQDFCNECLMG